MLLITYNKNVFSFFFSDSILFYTYFQMISLSFATLRYLHSSHSVIRFKSKYFFALRGNTSSKEL